MGNSFSAVPASYEYALAIQALHQGGIVAYPTETFYGLAVDPENPQAVSSLYRLKQRETEKALSLLVPNPSTLLSYVAEVPKPLKILMDAFWPGPLTLIFLSNNRVLQHLSKMDNSLAIRISPHPVANKFCSLWGGALTASSANISGEPALSSAEEVKRLLGDNLSYILDGGKTPGKVASTIIRCDNRNCTILRQGAISYQKIRRVLPAHYSIYKG